MCVCARVHAFLFHTNTDIRVKQIRIDPTISSLCEVARLMQSLYGLINEIQRQHSPELRSFATIEIKLTGYTDEHNMLQAMITLKTTRNRNRSRSDDKFNSGALHWELYVEYRIRPRVRVVFSEKQTWGHVLRRYINHESNVLVAYKPLESLASKLETTLIPTAR